MSSTSSTTQPGTTPMDSTSESTATGGRGGRGNDNRTGTGNGGRGAGRRNDRSRGRGRGGRGSTRTQTSGFRGETKDMNGNVFECHEESRDPTQFNRTLEALERYANKTYTSAQDLQSLFDDLVTPSVSQPAALDPTASELDKQIFNLRLKKFVDHEDTLMANMHALFAVIWGQCSATMTTKLETHLDLSTWKAAADCASLLKEIQCISLRYESQKNPFMMLHRQLRDFYRYRQRPEQTMHQYLEMFNLMTDNIDEYGGNVGYHKVFRDTLVRADGKENAMLTEAEETDYQRRAKEKGLAAAFLLGASEDIAQQVVADLENAYALGEDKFPETVTGAYNLLVHYRGVRRGRVPAGSGQPNGNLSFLQADTARGAGQGSSGSGATGPVAGTAS